MNRPTRPSARLQPERLEDRLTPTIAFGYDMGTISGTGLGSSQNSVAVGDFNGDGLEDMAFASYDAGVDIIMNEGYGNFDCTGHIALASGAPILIKAADVFGNGKVDLIVGCEWSNMVYVIPGNGDGTFGMPIPIGIGSNIKALAVADLTGDGQQDILVGTDQGTAIVLNNGAGGFDAPDLDPGAANAIAVGDFTGDGREDFAVSIQNSDDIDVFLNNGNGTFASPTVVACPDGYQPASLIAGDFNNDGLTDLAVNYSGTASIGVLLSNGDDTFQSPVWVNTGLSANSLPGFLGAADFDNDGNLDLAFDSNDGEVVIPGNGQGGFGTPISITGDDRQDYTGSGFAIGDLNGNGYQDLVNAGNFGVAFNLSGGSDINSFHLTAPAAAIVGQPFTLTVAAEAAGDAPLASYSGTIDWNIVGQQSGVGGGGTQYQSYDGGVMTFSVNPTAPGYLTIGVVDQNDPAATGSVTIPVAGEPTQIASSTSEVSAAAAVESSGTADTITVMVRNTSGGAVTGLTSGDFAFSLLGGTSTGTFGPVTETAPGTYTTAFTGQLAGTPDSILVEVDGVPLASEPTVSVAPGSADADATTVLLASPTVAFGADDVLTIVARDAAGNLIGDLTSTSFVTDIPAGTSTGTFSSVLRTSKTGVYTTTFTGLTAGNPSPVAVVIDGVEVAASPMVEVTAGAPSGSETRVSFASLTAPAADPELVTISVADAHGNAVSGLPSSAFSLALSGGTSTGMFGIASETTPGTYTVPFTGLRSGTAATLTLKVLGAAVTTEPTVIVIPGAVDPRLTTVSAAATTIAAGHSETVTLRVEDALGNPVGGLSSADFSCALESGASAGTFSPVTPTTTAGVYRTTLVGTTAGTPSWVAATVEGALLQSGPSIAVVPGAVDAASSTATVADTPLASGTTELLTVHAVDGEGNPVVGLSPKSFVVSLSGGQSTVQSGLATPTATPGTYTIPLTGLRAGSAASLSVTVSNVQLTDRPTVQVAPGTVSDSASKVSISKSTVRRYASVSISIQLRDAFGNAVTALAAADFILSLQGGQSGGDFGTVSETGNTGVYTATFTSYQTGTASLLIVEVLGQDLAQKPKLTVLS